MDRKTEVKEALEKAGLLSSGVCTINDPESVAHGEQYIPFFLKGGAFVKGNWKNNVKSALEGMVAVAQVNLDNFNEAIS